MYVLAGYKHTPGMPDMVSAIQRLSTGQASTAYKPTGVAGPQTKRLKAGLGKQGSQQRYKDGKYKNYGETH